MRAIQARAPAGPLGPRGETRAGTSRARAHRPSQAVGHRRPRRLGRRRGIEDHFQDGRFHDLFVRVTGPVVAQLQLVFLASFRWLSGAVAPERLDALFPELERGGDPCPRRAAQRARPLPADHDAIAELLDGARDTLDVVNPYVTDAAMIGRIAGAARRGVRVRLFVPASTPNNWACAAAQRFHHARLLDAGVRILGYPAMLHAKAFVRDGEEVLAGTCNLEAWSLKRFFEIDVQHSLARVRRAVRRALQRSGGSGLVTRPQAQPTEGAGPGHAFRRALPVVVTDRRH